MAPWWRWGRTRDEGDSADNGPSGRLPRRELTRRSRSDLLAALGVPQPEPARGSVAFLRRRPDGAEPGCPACRVADEESRRWFFFYETETNADEALRERLVAAGGMCPVHTRHLIEQGPAASWLARSLFELLVRDVREHPREVAVRRAQRCPVCVAVDGRVTDLLGLLAAGIAPGGRPGDGWTADGEDWDTAAESADGAAQNWDTAVEDVGTAVDDPRSRDIVAAYRAGAGLCVPHARRFVAGASPAASALVTAVLADRLATTPELAVAVVAGDDPDAAARARLRTVAAPGVLAADAAARRAGLPQRIEALLQRPCCPVCAARETATWRLLDWIGSGRALPTDDADAEGAGGAVPVGPGGAVPADVVGPGGQVPALERRGGRPTRARAGVANQGMREQLAALCPTHLTDLVQADGGGGWLSEPVASVVRIAAARWRAAAAAASGAALVGPGRSVRYPGRTVAELMTPRTSCPVCASSAQAAAREVTLMHLVGADPARALAVARSHGPCQRCRSVVAGPGAGPAGHPWEQAAASRTAELGFELAESLRQGSWTARWDVHGAEMSAWRRAPSRLDGAVLGPPPPGRTGELVRGGAGDGGRPAAEGRPSTAAPVWLSR